jgi:hypothetical protein
MPRGRRSANDEQSDQNADVQRHDEAEHPFHRIDGSRKAVNLPAEFEPELVLHRLDPRIQLIPDGIDLRSQRIAPR